MVLRVAHCPTSAMEMMFRQLCMLVLLTWMQPSDVNGDEPRSDSPLNDVLESVELWPTGAQINGSDLPDCECKPQWFHSDFLCALNESSHSNHGWVMMMGCPSLETLSICEDYPSQSWCETTSIACKQQVEDSVGNGWVYCDPIEQTPTLPRCLCKPTWAMDGGLCEDSPVTIHGCPTMSKLHQCYPHYYGTMRCDTVQDTCLEQEDEISVTGEKMVGHGWAYCNPANNEPLLPSCECQDSWTFKDPSCWNGQEILFHNCPKADEMGICGSQWSQVTGQTWCKTKRSRCQEIISTQNTVQAPLARSNTSWSFCNPETGLSELPACVCKSNWIYADNECADYPISVSGCPSVDVLRRCDARIFESFCETTSESCREQSNSMAGSGRVSCDSETDLAVLPKCECATVWQYPEETREGSCTQSMRGCPSLEELAQCDPQVASSFCQTKDLACAEQSDEFLGQGWVYCDHVTQLAVNVDYVDDLSMFHIVVSSTLAAILIVAISSWKTAIGSPAKNMNKKCLTNAPPQSKRKQGYDDFITPPRLLFRS